ncbi:hypothetical protein [Halalkalibacter oceani]|uniref:hypothetical protein n=1 Tax=Halalkalibacter oceani TaxID=1653776 RepID=UPI0033955FC8
MKTIKQLLSEKKVVASGFEAIKGLSDFSQGTEEVVLSSLSPAILAEQGVTEFYALQLPRGTIFNTSQEIFDADLPVRKYQIEVVDKLDLIKYSNPDKTVIASRHKGTIDILKKDWWLAPVFENVTAEDIKGKHVVGTLPPHLITECDMYTAVTIKDFDYKKDGDLTDVALSERLVVASNPIKVKELDI